MATENNCVPHLEESEIKPGYYHLYMGKEYMEFISPGQMIAIVSLFTAVLNKNLLNNNSVNTLQNE